MRSRDARVGSQDQRMRQSELFTVVTAPRFDGHTYDPAFDQDRLVRQLGRVWAVMQDHGWRTLGEIETATGDPQASISARIRDLRKTRFGGYVIERRRRGDPSDSLFEYRLL